MSPTATATRSFLPEEAEQGPVLCDVPGCTREGKFREQQEARYLWLLQDWHGKREPWLVGRTRQALVCSKHWPEDLNIEPDERRWGWRRCWEWSLPVRPSRVVTTRKADGFRYRLSWRTVLGWRQPGEAGVEAEEWAWEQQFVMRAPGEVAPVPTVTTPRQLAGRWALDCGGVEMPTAALVDQMVALRAQALAPHRRGPWRPTDDDENDDLFDLGVQS